MLDFDLSFNRAAHSRLEPPRKPDPSKSRFAPRDAQLRQFRTPTGETVDACLSDISCVSRRRESGLVEAFVNVAFKFRHSSVVHYASVFTSVPVKDWSNGSCLRQRLVEDAVRLSLLADAFLEKGGLYRT